MDKSKSQSGSVHLFIIAILVLALISGLGFVFWKNFTEAKSKNSTEPTSAYTIVYDVLGLISPIFSSPTTTIGLDDLSVSPAYKVKGADFYVATNYGNRLKIITKTTNLLVITYIDNYLTSHGFTKMDSNSAYDNKVFYQSPTIVCDLSKEGSIPIYLNCGDKDSYGHAATDAAPFAYAYAKNNVALASSAVYGVPNITKLASGYQHAIVHVTAYSGVGGTTALFYTKNNNWEYFTSTQSQLECDKYNTTEIRAAFYGEKCYITGTNIETSVK